MIVKPIRTIWIRFAAEKIWITAQVNYSFTLEFAYSPQFNNSSIETDTAREKGRIASSLGDPMKKNELFLQ